MFPTKREFFWLESGNMLLVVVFRPGIVLMPNQCVVEIFFYLLTFMHMFVLLMQKYAMESTSQLDTIMVCFEVSHNLLRDYFTACK